jgi:hypothetical protein
MTDERSIAAVDAAIAFGKGEIGIDELNRFAYAAYNAAYDAVDGIDAAYAAAHAAYVAPDEAAENAEVSGAFFDKLQRNATQKKV